MKKIIERERELVKQLTNKKVLHSRDDNLTKLSHDLEKRNKKEELLKKKLLRKQESFTTKKLMDNKRHSLKEQKKHLHNRQLLRKYLDMAGYEETDENLLTKKLFRGIIILCLTLTIVALFVASVGKPGIKDSILFLTGLWTGVFAGLFVLAWIFLYVFLDMKIFNRTMAVEEVLPDFLQLASANISAGMPIDRALWFAVRPRFGILAKEIEDVAKSTISGEDLKYALLRFADKYDSKMLKRSINLLIEGMDSGGEMADLLNKIALNIQETRILKKEMAANVMTYAIFIGFATIVAAPVLFGLAGQLLQIIQQIMGMLVADGGGGSSGGFALTVTENSITMKDFRIFSVVTLFLTGLFSSFIVSTIRKGSIKEGMRFIPVFVLATILLYFFSSWLLSLLLGGMLVV